MKNKKTKHKKTFKRSYKQENVEKTLDVDKRWTLLPNTPEVFVKFLLVLSAVDETHTACFVYLFIKYQKFLRKWVQSLNQ